MAAAYTSGVIAGGLADYYHENHDIPLSPNAVKAILEYTALPIPGETTLVAGNRRAQRDLARCDSCTSLPRPKPG